MRTNYDMEMMAKWVTARGLRTIPVIFTERKPGDPPPTLMDYLPKEPLIMIDESHVTIPQLTGMYRGDRARKTTLVEFGFRLPSALDNRPFTFEEFEAREKQALYISATPAQYELQKAKAHIVEQIIGPQDSWTLILMVKAAKNQMDTLIPYIRRDDVKGGERVLDHDPYQTICRGPHGLSPRLGHKNKISPFRHRHAGEGCHRKGSDGWENLMSL